MVQTSLAGWLRKPLPKQEEVTLPTSKPDAISELPTPPKDEDEAKVELGNGQADNAEDREDENATTESPQKSSVTTTTKTTLPPNATLASITADTLPSFKRMTTLLLPVAYPDKFYNEILSDSIASSISLVALWSPSPSSSEKATASPRVVSGIRCRLISHPLATSPAPSLYISTITTLAPFRGHGLARALLREVVRTAIEEYEIGTVTAHMWEANEEAGEWYEKMGFVKVKYEKEYYRKLKPGGAWLFERKVGPGDLLGG